MIGLLEVCRGFEGRRAGARRQPGLDSPAENNRAASRAFRRSPDAAGIPPSPGAVI